MIPPNLSTRIKQNCLIVEIGNLKLYGILKEKEITLIFDSDLLNYLRIAENHLLIDFIDLLIDEFDITDMVCLIERQDNMELIQRLSLLFPCTLVHIDKHVDEFNWVGLLCKI